MLGTLNKGVRGEDKTAHSGGVNSRAMVVGILDVELAPAFIDLLGFIS